MNNCLASKTAHVHQSSNESVHSNNEPPKERPPIQFKEKILKYNRGPLLVLLD
jgi:hypothetical protein